MIAHLFLVINHQNVTSKNTLVQSSEKSNKDYSHKIRIIVWRWQASLFYLWLWIFLERISSRSSNLKHREMVPSCDAWDWKSTFCVGVWLGPAPANYRRSLTDAGQTAKQCWKRPFLRLDKNIFNKMIQ